MAVPPHVAVAIEGTEPLRGTWATDRDCEGSKFHSPRPLVVIEVDLCPWDPGVTEYAWVCGTCADNLAVYQQILGAHDGDAPWELRREFGNRIRALGQRGWDRYDRMARLEVAGG